MRTCDFEQQFGALAQEHGPLVGKRSRQATRWLGLLEIREEFFHGFFLNSEALIKGIGGCDGLVLKEGNGEPNLLLAATDDHGLNGDRLTGLISIPVFPLKRDGNFSADGPRLIALHTESADAYVCNSVGPGGMSSSQIRDYIGNNQPSVSSLVREESANDALKSGMEDESIPVEPKGTLARCACCCNRLRYVPLSVLGVLERIRFRHRQFPEDTQGYRQWDREPIPQNVQGGCGFGGDSRAARTSGPDAVTLDRSRVGGTRSAESRLALA